MLKEIKERHENYNNFITVDFEKHFKLAHQDRAELLKLLDEAKKIIEEFQSSMEEENGDRWEKADEFLSKLD